MQKKIAPIIIDALTADLLVSELGFTERNLRHARQTGKFASAWYSSLKDLCESHGIHCPLEAFNWKPIAKKDGIVSKTNQVALEKIRKAVPKPLAQVQQ